MQNLDHVDQMIRDNQSPGTAPKVTIDDLTSEIQSLHFFTALQGARMEGLDYIDKMGQLPQPEPLHPALGQLTICVIVLKNGFTCTGESACVSAANFDEGYGRKLAKGKAMDKAWSYLAFRLADRLAAGAQA